MTAEDELKQEIRQLRSQLQKYRKALEEIDRCVVGGCEDDFGNIEPCDSCVEMRTIAQNALRP